MQLKHLVIMFILSNLTILSQEQVVKEKSTEKAVWLAVGSTLAPAALGLPLVLESDSKTGWVFIGLGAGFGPSIGKMYAEDYFGALTGVTIRLVSGIVGASFSGFPKGENYAGVLVCTTSFFYDFFTTARSVRKYNEKSLISISPFYNGRTKLIGLNLTYHK